jgi:hypothetical protein
MAATEIVPLVTGAVCDCFFSEFGKIIEIALIDSDVRGI